MRASPDDVKHGYLSGIPLSTFAFGPTDRRRPAINNAGTCGCGARSAFLAPRWWTGSSRTSRSARARRPWRLRSSCWHRASFGTCCAAGHSTRTIRMSGSPTRCVVNRTTRRSPGQDLSTLVLEAEVGHRKATAGDVCAPLRRQQCTMPTGTGRGALYGSFAGRGPQAGRVARRWHRHMSLLTPSFAAEAKLVSDTWSIAINKLSPADQAPAAAFSRPAVPSAMMMVTQACSFLFDKLNEIGQPQVKQVLASACGHSTHQLAVLWRGHPGAGPRLCRDDGAHS